MRFIVYGAGAVGGVIGGRLAEHGNEVVLIARGAHAEAIARSGLTIESPDGTCTVAVPVVTDPSALTFGSGDVVVIAVKSQDTAVVLDRLRLTMPPDVPVVCAQNGVVNELAALRLFPNVYAVNVMCPTTHLVPGVVQAFTSPVSGILDLGRYPSGVDHMCEQVAAALERSTFVSQPRTDIMRWKYSKLLMNLANAIEAVCGSSARGGPLITLLRNEGTACLVTAGIEFATVAEDADRRGHLLQVRPIGGHHRGGGSTWQSLARVSGSIETDYLNGEIVLLGRLHGVPTPANDLLQRLVHNLAVGGLQPGAISADEVLRRLGASPAT